ncbi:hypothetical protein JTB14_006786 [Gonioctena quinquepunctata]|nr:hypothetical protein JTB14_006786 [Gonioctena quinquepunctata]
MLQKVQEKSVSGFKCINCNSVFHDSCAEAVNYVKFIAEELITCCEINVAQKSNCDSVSDGAFFESLENMCIDKKVDISIFRYVLSDSEKSGSVSTATTQGQFSHTKQSTHHPSPHSDVVGSSWPPQHLGISEQTLKLSLSLWETDTRAKCDRYINLSNKGEVNEGTEDHFTKVTYKKNKKGTGGKNGDHGCDGKLDQNKKQFSYSSPEYQTLWNPGILRNTLEIKSIQQMFV